MENEYNFNTLYYYKTSEYNNIINYVIYEDSDNKVGRLEVYHDIVYLYNSLDDCILKLNKSDYIDIKHLLSQCSNRLIGYLMGEEWDE